MLQRDYLLRMIEQLAAVVAYVIALSDRGRQEEALNALSRAYGQLVGLDADLVRTLAADSLTALLRSGESLDAGKCLALAELLEREGDVCDRQGRPVDAGDRRVTALGVRLAIWSSAITAPVPDNATRLDSLLTRLRGQDFPPATRRRRVRYYEVTGRYADAEDQLFDLLETGTPAPDLLEEGIGFYERLLTKSRAALVRGRLPRTEVREGLAKLIATRRPV